MRGRFLSEFTTQAPHVLCSGRKISEILKKNPSKDPEKYEGGTSRAMFNKKASVL